MGSLFCLTTEVTAIEVGDVFFTGNGPGQTVTAVKRLGRDTVQIVEKTLRDNAAEFCERSNDLAPHKPGYDKCINDVLSSSGRSGTIMVNCRTATILTEGGAYRRPPGGEGPWVGTAQGEFSKTTSIIKGEQLFRMACRSRR
jgi:hypothetical protein